MVTFLPPVAALEYPAVLVTAPSPICMVKEVISANRPLSASDSTRRIILPDMVELPVRYAVLEPAAMPIFEPFTLPMSLLNCIDMVPLPV